MRACLAMLLLVMTVSGLAGAAPAAPAASADRGAPRAENAWVRRNAVPGRPSAGYLTITGGGRADRLVAVSAPGTRIELHSMTMAGGVMSMARIDGVDVPARGAARFAPGGNHLMIFGLPAKATTLPLTLTFASGTKVAATATIRAAGDAAPAATMPMDHGRY